MYDIYYRVITYNFFLAQYYKNKKPATKILFLTKYNIKALKINFLY